jgi:hypothetical protein
MSGGGVLRVKLSVTEINKPNNTMSLSKPVERIQHPAKRWFEWQGSEGHFRYYDKEKKERVDVPLPFVFLWLDELVAMSGFHEPSASGITSNEIRDTTTEVLSVKAFGSPHPLATGLYQSIKHAINAAGGYFCQKVYIGFREAKGQPLQLACVQFAGAALNSWIEFKNANPGKLITHAISVKSFLDGKKGSVKFRTPVFTLVPRSEETLQEAIALDKILQDYLDGYFKRTRSLAPAVDPQSQPDAPSDVQEAPPEPVAVPTAEPEEDDLEY